MKFVIHSPAGVQAEMDEVAAVRTILADGKPLTILPRHAALMAELGQEPVFAVRDDNVETFHVNRGILIVATDVVKVLTEDIAEWEGKDA